MKGSSRVGDRYAAGQITWMRAGPGLKGSTGTRILMIAIVLTTGLIIVFPPIVRWLWPLQ